MNLSLTGLALLFAVAPVALAATGAPASPRVILETSKGGIVLSFIPTRRPSRSRTFSNT